MNPTPQKTRRPLNDPSPYKMNPQKPEALIKTDSRTQCNRTQSNDTAVQRLWCARQCAREMGEAPPQAAYGSRLQTTFERRRSRAFRRECRRKRRGETASGMSRKVVQTAATNASEPLMTRRNWTRRRQNREVKISPGSALGISVYCLGGVRRRSGVIPIRARVCNWGTCRLDVKGAVQVEDPRGLEYRCEAQGRINP